MSKFDLVIFDCDGVLVDSEPITNQVLCDMLNELGAVITVEDTMRRYVGKSVKEDLHITRSLLGRPPPPDFYLEFVRRRDEALTGTVTAVAHVRSAIESIRLPIAVATGADTSKMKLTLGTTGLLPHFEGRMFSASMVEHSKPAPDVYLLAARTLGASPTRCAVIEDTPTGTTAGVAAGMTVFGYCERQNGLDLLAAGAAAVFQDMRHLHLLIN